MRGVRTSDTVMLDDKGRINLPHRLRVRLEADDRRLLVLHFFRGAVWAWLPEAFEEHVERVVGGEGHLTDEALDRAHAWLGTCDTVEIDAQGRIRVGAELRTLAGLEKEVRVISVLDRLELWSPERWAKRFADAQQAASAPAPRVATAGEGA